MTDRARDAMTGLCAISAVVAFIIILQLFGEWYGPPTWRLTLHAPASAGLADNSKVKLDGVPIGVVEAVELSGDRQWPVRVTAQISLDTEIPSNVVPLTTTSLLTGAADLYLESSRTVEAAPLPRDGSAMITGTIESSALRDITKAIDSRVGPALGAISRLAPLLSSSPNPDQPGIPDLIRQATDTVEAARAWLEDPELREGANEAMHLALRALDGTITTVESIDGLVASAGRVLDTDIASAGRSLSEAMHNVASVMASIQDGEGTAGQLLTNPDLYNSLAASATQLERLAQSMRLMVEQIREEGVGPLISP